MTRRRLAMALATALLAAGCTNGNSDTVRQVASTVLPKLKTSKAELEAQRALVNAAVVADPEGLRNFPAPILLITADEVDVVGIIGPLVEHDGESVWYSADKNSIAFRDGQIVATRGLPVDLQSADVPDVRHQRGPAVRDHYYRDGDEVIRRHRFYCEITDRGPATAQVLDRSYPTRLVEESCEGQERSFKNAYWIDAAGEFRLSRVWVAPVIGYVAVQKVQD